MNKKLSVPLIVGLILASLAATAMAHFTQNLNQSKNETALILDVSGSTRSICQSLHGETSRAMDESDSITVYATGIKSTGHETFRVASYSDISTFTFSLSKQKNMQESKQEILRELKEKCEKELAPLEDRSAIYRAIARVVAMLKSRKCMEGGKCTVRVITDGQETVNKHVKKAIRSKKPKAVPDELLIDNGHIAVGFCGTADGKINSGSINHLEKGWMSYFQHPELVAFRPFCNVQ